MPRHWKGHLLHILLLAVVFLCYRQRSIFQDKMLLASGAMAQVAMPFVQSENERCLRQIESGTRYAENAGVIMRLINDEKTFPGGFPAIETLKSGLIRLADTLRYRSGADTLTARHIETALLQPEVFLPENTASGVQQVSALAHLYSLRMMMAANTALQHLRWTTEPVNVYPPAQYLPVIQSFEPVPKAGQPFNADIFASAFIPFEKDVTIRINGRQYPVRNGIAHFEHTFSKPGRYIQSVEMLAPPPQVPRYKVDSLQTERRSFQKDFEVWVWQ